MKILLRNWGNEVYVWQDATYERNGFRVDDSIIQEVNIVSVLDDNRNRYFKCSACGEVFRKGSTKWAKHIEPTTDTSKCFKCQHLRQRNTNIKKAKYTLLPNGKYEMAQKGETELICSARYWSTNINSEDARTNCVYNQCTTATQSEIEDIFTTYDGVFDDIITVDQVVKNGYTEISCSQYRLKAKNNIWANVNKLNIVDSFDVCYRSSWWTVYYSKKYDKLFVVGNRGKYEEFHPYGLPISTRENIKAKIASLYE